jgi:hypothetical protein
MERWPARMTDGASTEQFANVHVHAGKDVVIVTRVVCRAKLVNIRSADWHRRNAK